jgi:hypothetical protein
MNNEQIKPVSKNEFYSIIGQLDVTLSVRGQYPYTTLFKTRHGDVKGKSVDSHGNGRLLTKYFLYS